MAQRYVIVGASLAGATAAITLREEGADGTVTLIGAENGAALRTAAALQGLPARRCAFRQGAGASGRVLQRSTASRPCSEHGRRASIHQTDS